MPISHRSIKYEAMKTNFFSCTNTKLEELFDQNGLSVSVLKQMNKLIYHQSKYHSSQWEGVSKESINKIDDVFNFKLPNILHTHVSTDNTVKFLIGLHDKMTIETVIIPGENRNTICVSSQVGCAVGCNFCHTASQGFNRNLAVDEIIGQYLVANKWCLENDRPPITNLVFMGQGEPLNNFQNVKSSIELLLEDTRINLSRNKVTLSTSGLAPQIKKWDQFPDINVAISLHAAKDDTRSSLMPINNIHNLHTLFEAIKNLPKKNSKKVSFEYLLIDDVNNSLEDINALCELLDKQTAKINLIPFNQYPGSPYKSPSHENVKWFQKQLHNNGFTCTIRKRMGDDILAACGQLKSQHKDS